MMIETDAQNRSRWCGQLGMVLVLLFLSLSAALADSQAARLGKANEAYHAADYQAALAGYQELIAEDEVAEPVLFFNAGNAAYKLGDTGRAVLNYRRALALDPQMSEASRNLEFIGKESDRKFHNRGWLPPWVAALGTAWPLIIAAGAFWLALGLLIWRIRQGPPLTLTFSMAFLLLAVGGGALFSVNLWHSPGANDFVVVAESVTVRTSPSESAATAAVLGGGEAVTLVKESGEWVYISSDESEPGWVLSKSLEPVIPRN